MQHPWIGKHYKSKDNLFGGRRVLIIGESHYGSKPEHVGVSDPRVTIEVLEKHLSYTDRVRFFTRMVAHLKGEWGSQNRTLSDEIWQHLAFYNYVPVIVGSKPREFADWNFWKLGVPEFNRVLAEHQPDVIIVLGYRLWTEAYHRHTDGAVLPADTQTMFVSTVFNDRLIPTMKTAHPSTKQYRSMELHHGFKEMLAGVE